MDAGWILKSSAGAKFVWCLKLPALQAHSNSPFKDVDRKRYKENQTGRLDHCIVGICQGCRIQGLQRISEQDDRGWWLCLLAPRNGHCMHFVRRSRSICRANDCFQAEGDGARGKIDDFKEYHTVACWQLLAIYLNSVNPLGLSWTCEKGEFVNWSVTLLHYQIDTSTLVFAWSF